MKLKIYFLSIFFSLLVINSQAQIKESKTYNNTYFKVGGGVSYSAFLDYLTINQEIEISHKLSKHFSISTLINFGFAAFDSYLDGAQVHSNTNLFFEPIGNHLSFIPKIGIGLCLLYSHEFYSYFERNSRAYGLGYNIIFENDIVMKNGDILSFDVFVQRYNNEDSLIGVTIKSGWAFEKIFKKKKR